MKKIILTAILFSQFFVVVHAEYVGGYVKQNGTVVSPYNRTMPDNIRVNNYSSQGNYNPYTLKRGTVNPYKTYTPPAYSQPRMPKFNNKIAPLAGG
jgi:hypothetical protein